MESGPGETPPTASASESNRPRPPLSRRRDKPQLSCTLCRRRKLKCDRGQPCDTCARRGLSSSCSYASPTVLQSGKQRIDPTAVRVQEKISQLEKLVVSLMSGTEQSLPSSDPSQLPDSFGRISLENAETNYVESSHWTAILDGIADLKDYFEDHPHTAEQQQSPKYEDPGSGGPALILGRFQHLDRQQIVSSIPPRSIADRVVAKYFNTVAVTTVLIHGPTFLEEYEAFWKDPSTASVMWIGLLFGILCLGSFYQRLTVVPAIPPAALQSDLIEQQTIQTYRERVVQCLALANYTKCGPYTMEALGHYLHIEFLHATDTETGLWVLMGIVVRIALRMGYHRDGSHTPRLSPFQAEMRRRVWAVVFQVDSAVANQCGLPRTIDRSQVDTAEPLNVLDEDLSPYMPALPPARPESEPTLIQFTVAKNRIISVLNMITDLITCPRATSPYAEALKLDKLLHDTFNSLPSALRMRPMSRSLMDSPDTIVNRVFLALTFQKSRCLLHRKYLLAGRSDNTYSYSRKTCIEASLEILKVQAVMHQETQPGGRLYQNQWKFSAVIRNDFLLATTILCLDIDAESAQPLLESELKERVIQALTASYQIWLQSSDTSRESEKVAEVLRLVLNKAQRTTTRGPIRGDMSALVAKETSSLPDPSLVNPATSSQEPIVNPVTFFSTLSFQGNAYDPQLDHFDETTWDLCNWTGNVTMDDLLRDSQHWSALEER